jgi:hypothetical protein
LRTHQRATEAVHQGFGDHSISVVELGVAIVGDSQCRDQQNEIRVGSFARSPLKSPSCMPCAVRFEQPLLADRGRSNSSGEPQCPPRPPQPRRMGRTSPVVARPLDQAVGTRMYLETRVLVTGRTGFLGSHLCERLLDAGHQVLCVEQFLHRDVPEDDPKQRRPGIEYARKGWDGHRPSILTRAFGGQFPISSPCLSRGRST